MAFFVIGDLVYRYLIMYGGRTDCISYLSYLARMLSSPLSPRAANCKVCVGALGRVLRAAVAYDPQPAHHQRDHLPPCATSGTDCTI
jgi:hypothetical protein